MSEILRTGLRFINCDRAQGDKIIFVRVVVSVPIPERFLLCFQRLCERGAQMGQRAGWEQPNWFARPGDEPGYKPSFRRTNWFEPVGRECDLVLNKVGIVDLTPYGKIEVKGKNAASFMDIVFANELPKVSIVMFLNGDEGDDLFFAIFVVFVVLVNSWCRFSILVYLNNENSPNQSCGM